MSKRNKRTKFYMTSKNHGGVLSYRERKDKEIVYNTFNNVVPAALTISNQQCQRDISNGHLTEVTPENCTLKQAVAILEYHFGQMKNVDWVAEAAWKEAFDTLGAWKEAGMTAPVAEVKPAPVAKPEPVKVAPVVVDDEDEEDEDEEEDDEETSESAAKSVPKARGRKTSR